MFNFKKKELKTTSNKEIVTDSNGNIPITVHKDNTDEILFEMLETIKLIANHKRFEHIQKKIDVIQNLLDKRK